MSNLRVRQIQAKIMERFSPHIDMYGISDKDKEREVKIYSRCLAALSIQLATGCTSEEAGRSVWDGGDDNGIDAAYYNASENEVVIAQSKWIQSGSGEPEAKEVSTFIDGVNDLIENDIAAFGNRLEPKCAVISDALLQPGTTIRVVLVSTGSSTLAEHSTNKIEKCLEGINGKDTDAEDKVASFEAYGIEEVYKFLSNELTAGKTNINATILDWSRVSHPYDAYFGVIDGSQLKSWWMTFGKRIVAKNIRHALGNTDVNQQIKNTAEKSPEHFWYFNNGITLIADEVTKAPSAATSRSAGNFELKGASIVNGAQTVSTLSKIDDQEALGNSRISIRVISLKDAPNNFGQDVTRTNNLQNRIEGRDFVSNDAEQERIKSEMAMEDIVYQIHRSEEYVASSKSCDLIEVTTALACAHEDAALSVAVKTGIGRFYLDLSKSPYKAIFNKQTNGPRAFNAVRVLRIVDNWINAQRAKTEKRGYQWGALVHGNRAIAASVFKKLGTKYLEFPINSEPADLEKTVTAHCENVYRDMLEILNSDFPNKSLAVLFKSPANCKHLHDRI